MAHRTSPAPVSRPLPRGLPSAATKNVRDRKGIFEISPARTKFVWSIATSDLPLLSQGLRGAPSFRGDAEWV